MPASRSRGSRKVPNVKIRSVPQLPTAPKKKIRDEKDADETTETESEGNDDEDRDADSAFQTDNANRLISPLSGCILCSTGIAKPEKVCYCFGHFNCLYLYTQCIPFTDSSGREGKDDGCIVARLSCCRRNTSDCRWCRFS